MHVMIVYLTYDLLSMGYKITKESSENEKSY
jgi:hypothetical protein